MFGLALPVLTAAVTAVLGVAPASPSPAANPNPTSTAEYIVVLRDGANPAAVADRHKTADKAAITHVYGAPLNGFSADLTRPPWPP